MEINPSDSGVSAALSQALGHPAPFSEAECAALEGPLIVQQAGDLSELRHCARLRHLELIASDIRELAPLSSLKELRLLAIVACPVEDPTPLRELPELEHLTLNFTHVQSIASLIGMPALRRVELQGNPLTEEAFRQLAQLSSAPSPKTKKPPRLLPPARKDWEITRKLWERGIPAGLANIDFRGWFLVRAGSPRLIPGPCDAVSHHPVLLKQQLGKEPPPTVETLFQNATRHLPSPPAISGARLRSQRPWGDSEEAASWVRASALEESTKALLLQFIAQFPTLTFYRETPEYWAELEAETKVQLPGWLRALRQTLAWIMPEEESMEVRVRFRQFDFPGHASSTPDRWYALVPGRPSGKEQQQLLEQLHMMKVAIAEDLLWSQLLIPTGQPEDRSIYDFAEEMYRDLQAEGRGTEGTLGRAFESYASMLAAIDAVRVREGEPLQAIRA